MEKELKDLQEYLKNFTQYCYGGEIMDADTKKNRVPYNGPIPNDTIKELINALISAPIPDEVIEDRFPTDTNDIIKQLRFCNVKPNYIAKSRVHEYAGRNKDKIEGAKWAIKYISENRKLK